MGVIGALFGAPSDDEAVARAGRGLDGLAVLDGIPMPEDLDGLVAEARGVGLADLPDGPSAHWVVDEAVVLTTRADLRDVVGALDDERLPAVAEAWEDHAVGWYGPADDIVGAVTVLRDFLAARAAAGERVYAYVSP